jgi:CHAT domain-containing protein/Tfp pilus assembly protein PilF
MEVRILLRATAADEIASFRGRKWNAFTSTFAQDERPEFRMMNRSVCTIAVINLLVGCVPPRRPSILAYHVSARPSTTFPLDEATQLDVSVGKLQAAGKVRDAISGAERSLFLREKALGPAHVAVALSLNNVAVLYRALAEYGKAEPLLIRALDIRERLLGPLHPDVAQSLNELGLLYLDRAEYGKAEPLLIRALDIHEKAARPMSPQLARSLNSLARLYRARGAYSKAEPLQLRALDIQENALGPMHPEVATSLRSLAELYRMQAAFEKTDRLYARALDITEKALGPMHPDVARGLAGVARLRTDQGAYDEAEPLLVRALDIAEKRLGPTHPEVARMINSLGTLYGILGANDKAELLQTRALSIAEKTLGPWHPDVAQYLNSLATVLWAQGAFSDAEALYARALEITEKVFGPTHRNVAIRLGNLGIALQEQGAYGRAEVLYVRALDITEKAFGPMHPQMAAALNNLATVYWEQGAFEKAEPLLVRALDIREKALAPMHADVGQSVHNLAELQFARGAYAKAEALYVRALNIHETAFGPMNLEVAKVLTSFAWLYRDQAMYRKAEPLLTRALEIYEKALGHMHPSAAVTLQHLAAVYRDQRAYGKAEPLALRALDIREKALGPMHPDVALALHSLGKLYWAQGAYKKVEPALSRAAEIREDQLRLELPRLSEPRKRALMAFLQEETDSLVALHAHALPRSQRALELAVTTILRRKGRILDSLVDNETALRAHLTPRLRKQLDQLDRARTELAAKLYTPGDATDRAAIAAVRAHIEDLESRLSSASSDFRVQAEPVTVAKVQAAVPSGAAVVEFVRYHRFDPKQVQPSREDRYVAYLLTRQGPLQWVALGAAAPIDAQVDAVLAAMNDKLPAAVANARLRRLDAVVFAPIRARLADVSHLILAPDGKLNLLPFEALLDASGHHALESYLVSYVTTGRDLLRFGAPLTPRSTGAIFAAPDYGPLPSPPSTVSFTPLTEALGEAADLEKYFRVRALTGDKATKSALKALTGPAMLHVATHGFYAQKRGARPAPAPRNLSREILADPSWRLPAPARPDDPIDGLDRAGLAMAGANQSATGIVTAREIAGFDWWGTQLVVLSACETGVGAAPSGDGVYGMRRALVLAGAASQVVSLWSVDDASTRTLMRQYYAQLAHGTGRAEALRQAKLRMIREPRYAHPHHWAAFIPAGDWRPLDSTAMMQQRLDP